MSIFHITERNGRTGIAGFGRQVYIVHEHPVHVAQINARSRQSWIATGLFAISVIALANLPSSETDSRLIAGFNSEFIEREDGFKGLDSLYNLPLEIKEMEISLMYISRQSVKARR